MHTVGWYDLLGIKIDILFDPWFLRDFESAESLPVSLARPDRSEVKAEMDL